MKPTRLRNQLNVNPWYEPTPRSGIRRVHRRIVLMLLMVAEYLVLWTYGWRRTRAHRLSEQAWRPPPTHPKHSDVYGRTHAINSLRYYNDPSTQLHRKDSRRRG